MATEYMIRSGWYQNLKLSINKDEFDNIKKQTKTLKAVQELQIRYEMILKNYMTLEKELYSMVLEYDLKRRDYDSFLEDKIRVYTLFLNLLTAAISYRNYVRDDNEKVAEQKLFNIFNIDKEHIEEIFSKEGYDFLAGIRNQLQHGRALHHSTFNMSMPETKAEGNSRKIGHILIKLDLYVDRNNKKLPIPPIFKDKLKDGQLSLHYVGRFCMDIHNKIHYEIIDIIKHTIQEARTDIENIHKNWEKYVEEKIPDNNTEDIKARPCAYAYTVQDSNITEGIRLFLELDDARKILSKKNRRDLDLLETNYEL